MKRYIILAAGLALGLSNPALACDSGDISCLATQAAADPGHADPSSNAVKFTGEWICRYFNTPEEAEQIFELHPKKVQTLCKVTLGFPTITLCPAYEPANPGDEQLDDTVACSTIPWGGSPSNPQ